MAYKTAVTLLSTVSVHRRANTRTHTLLRPNRGGSFFFFFITAQIILHTHDVHCEHTTYINILYRWCDIMLIKKMEFNYNMRCSTRRTLRVHIYYIYIHIILCNRVYFSTPTYTVYREQFVFCFNFALLTTLTFQKFSTRVVKFRTHISFIYKYK